MSTFPVSIAESEEEQVKELAQMMTRQRAALVGPDDQRHEIPDSVYRLLLSVLKIMQEGKAVSIVPQMQELTTRRAANLLGVSRQFFVRLLDDEKLPFHRTGTTARGMFRKLTSVYIRGFSLLRTSGRAITTLNAESARPHRTASAFPKLRFMSVVPFGRISIDAILIG